MITLKSENLKTIKNLDVLLEEPINHQEQEETSCLAVWGNEQPLENPNNYPILRLQDSLYSIYGEEKTHFGLNFAYQNNLYYSLKNSVTDFLNSDWEISESDIAYSQKAIQMINKYCITKNNQYPVFKPENPNPENSILIIDQSLNSQSVIENQANMNNFSTMFMYAFENFPNAKIYIKYHPDTINGTEEGYIHKFLKKNKLLEHPSLHIIDYHCNVASLFYYVSDVLTVTSPVGFEALLRGKNVTTFGNSFYSGHGVTTDQYTLIKKPRNVLEIFHALFIQNTIYLNPFNNQKGGLLDVLEYISLQKRHQNSKHVVFFRTEFSKSKNIVKLLNLESKENIYINNQSKILLQDSKLILVDSQKHMNHLPKKHSKAFVGEGFLFPTETQKNQPMSMIIDFSAAYYHNKINSDLDEILNNEPFTDYELENAKLFIEDLKIKFNKELEIFPKGTLDTIQRENKKVIFIPGNSEQVQNLFELPINSDLELILNVAQREKDSIIIYKPASDSKIKKTKDLFKSGVPNSQAAFRENNNQIFIETEAHSSHIINICDEVHLISNSLGIESLIQNKKVINYGQTFFSGRGLTTDVFKSDKQKKEISLERLILGALMLYPRYKIPTNDCFVSSRIALNYYVENIEQLKKDNRGFFAKLLGRKQ